MEVTCSEVTPDSFGGAYNPNQIRNNNFEYDPKYERLAGFLLDSQLVDAIRETRSVFGLGLLESKNTIEGFWDFTVRKPKRVTLVIKDEVVFRVLDTKKLK
jgi:hypothetical protein